MVSFDTTFADLYDYMLVDGLMLESTCHSEIGDSYWESPWMWDEAYFPCFTCDPLPGSVEENVTSYKPEDIIISQNSPNPFNSATMIEYTLPEDSDVKVEILNILGQNINTIVNEFKFSGTHSVRWDCKDISGNDVPAGSYFYKITAGDYETQKRMLYIK